MRIKTIVIIIIAVLLTIIMMQNTGSVPFKFLWTTFAISKLIILALVALAAFILGVLAGRPHKVKRLSDDFDGHNYDDRNPNTLSNEDRDYIN